MEKCFLKDLKTCKKLLAQKTFCFYGIKLYSELPIGIWQLDAISKLKFALRRHFLRYYYLNIVHAYMYFISTPIFSGLCFFLNILLLQTIFAAYFRFRCHYLHSAICVCTFFKVMASNTRFCLYFSCFISFIFCINLIKFITFNFPFYYTIFGGYWQHCIVIWLKLFYPV